MPITLSSSITQSLKALSQIQDDSNQSTLRISTGKKINSAMDGAATYMLAKTMDDRASLLNKVNDGIKTSMATLKLAETSCDTIVDYLTKAQKAMQAASATSTSATSAPVSTASFSATVTGATALNAGMFEDGDVLKISAGAGTTQVSMSIKVVTAFGGALGGQLGDGSDGNPLEVRNITDVINTINGFSGWTSGARVTASLSGGRLQMNSNQDMTIQQTANVGTAQSLGSMLSVSGVSTPTGITGTLGGNVVSFAVPSATSSANARKTAADLFRNTLDSVFNLVQDAQISGVNMLKGDKLSVALNESYTTKFDIQFGASDPNTLGLNWDTTTKKSSLASGDFQSDPELATAITKITSAITTIKDRQTQISDRASLLNMRADYNAFLQKSLAEASDALTAADIAEETAKRNQAETSAQFTINSITSSQRMDQALLSLLR
ncbi:hypothetical protein ABEG18_16255 [Alsobacter sp. KACC 23698]|uniref:Flagellin N-terminal domain-containing protein n=1 Tax=Alsobacter sp. KACC 23698 TaxID=3149229 RepID=A0AAU7JAD8_9HYPH